MLTRYEPEVGHELPRILEASKVVQFCGEHPGQVRRLFHQNKPRVGRTMNDFQTMFREIYEETWRVEEGHDPVQAIFLRLTEELAEVAEALRFHHLYPENLDNELADFFSWWFALLRRTVLPTIIVAVIELPAPGGVRSPSKP